MLAITHPPEIREYTFGCIIPDSDSAAAAEREQLDKKARTSRIMFLSKGFTVRRSSTRLQVWTALDIASRRGWQ